MSCIRSKNTGIEKFLAAKLAKRGYKFRKHYSLLPGKPDIVLEKYNTVIFVDGDFWHGWHFNKWQRKLKPYWKNKITGNIRRDKSNLRKLRYRGWIVIRVWEHEFKDIDKVIDRIVKRINSK